MSKKEIIKCIESCFEQGESLTLPKLDEQIQILQEISNYLKNKKAYLENAGV